MSSAINNNTDSDDVVASAPLHHAESLPSIDELDPNTIQVMMHQQLDRSTRTKHGAQQQPVHRRVRSSVTTTANHQSKSPSSELAFQCMSNQILQNMMRTHINRNPYKDYIVLEMIGEGSIGSVQKVVRKHHSLIHHHATDDEKLEGDDGEDDVCCGGGKSSWCWGGLFSKLFRVNNQKKDVFFFRSTTNTAVASKQQSKLSDESNNNASIVSESSAFSAPTTPTIPHYDQRQNNKSDVLIQSSSQHDNMILSSHVYPNLQLGDGHYSYNSSMLFHNNHPNAHQHPLRRYALKSIRLDRRTTTTKKKRKNGGSSCGDDSSYISSSDEAELRNEISILRSLDHPHIVHIIETYEYNNLIYMVIDLCENGDLYVLDPYSEDEAKLIIIQLLQAVSYMHHRGIVHRDLKVSG